MHPERRTPRARGVWSSRSGRTRKRELQRFSRRRARQQIRREESDSDVARGFVLAPTHPLLAVTGVLFVFSPKLPHALTRSLCKHARREPKSREATDSPDTLPRPPA